MNRGKKFKKNIKCIAGLKNCRTFAAAKNDRDIVFSSGKIFEIIEIDSV